MADETNNDTMDAILSEMEGFKCRNLETGELEKCHPISGYLHDRIKAVYERDMNEIKTCLRDACIRICYGCKANIMECDGSTGGCGVRKWRILAGMES